MRIQFTPLFIFAIAGALLAAVFCVGCTNASSRPSTRWSMAVAVTTPDAPPSAEELATIHRLLHSQITSRGFTVATTLASADYIMRVRFTPDKVNPPGGHLEFLGIEQNSRQNARGGENAAAEASARALAELREVISKIESLNAASLR